VKGARKKTLLLCLCLVLAGGAAVAQGRGPGGGGPPGGGGMGGPGGGGPPGGMSGGPGRSGAPGDGRGNGPGNAPGGARPNDQGAAPGSGGARPNVASSPARGGLQLGPPGRWWDDKTFARDVGLTREQQKKMDSVFDANKGAIVDTYNALQREQAKLQTLSQAKTLDESKIFAQIDAVAQAKVALEKANAHMLLLVRQQMDAEQQAKMDKYRERPPE
jgi:Spy/CpxP family protein refolding chaperone